MAGIVSINSEEYPLKGLIRRSTLPSYSPAFRTTGNKQRSDDPNLNYCWIQVGTTIFEYGLPALAGITDVYTEGTQDGVFDARIPRRWWDVNREVSPRRLVLAGSVGGKAAWSPVTGKVLKIVGQAYPTLPSTETTNVVVDPEYVLARAALNLVEGLPREQRSTFPDYGRWLRDAEQMEARGETRLDPDAIQVEPA